MSNYPVKRKSRPVRVLEGKVVDTPPPVAKANSGFSFRYSYAEFSVVGRSAHFKARRARYEDGKLATESFEGGLDPKTYEHLMNDVQRFFADQTALYLQAFRTLMLPFGQGRDRE